jgi:hypothetical protein
MNDYFAREKGNRRNKISRYLRNEKRVGMCVYETDLSKDKEYGLLYA